MKEKWVISHKKTGQMLVDGWPYWTTDKDAALSYASLKEATLIADGIGERNTVRCGVACSENGIGLLEAIGFQWVKIGKDHGKI